MLLCARLAVSAEGSGGGDKMSPDADASRPLALLEECAGRPLCRSQVIDAALSVCRKRPRPDRCIDDLAKEGESHSLDDIETFVLLSALANACSDGGRVECSRAAWFRVGKHFGGLAHMSKPMSAISRRVALHNIVALSLEMNDTGTAVQAAEELWLAASGTAASTTQTSNALRMLARAYCADGQDERARSEWAKLLARNHFLAHFPPDDMRPGCLPTAARQPGAGADASEPRDLLTD